MKKKVMAVFIALSVFFSSGVAIYAGPDDSIAPPPYTYHASICLEIVLQDFSTANHTGPDDGVDPPPYNY